MRIHHRVVLLGSCYVGKSSLALQQCKNLFPQDYSPTIEDQYEALLHIKKIPSVLDVLDTSGNKGCSELQTQAIQYAQAFILVYSITDLSSWNTCWDIYILIRKLRIDNPPMMLVGNKSDLKDQRQVSFYLGKRLAAFMKCPFMEITSTRNIEVKNTFNCICSKLSPSTFLSIPTSVRKICKIM